MIRISTLVRLAEDQSIAAAKQLKQAVMPARSGNEIDVSYLIPRVALREARTATARGLIKLANAIS
jgi:hypothetical protein